MMKHTFAQTIARASAFAGVLSLLFAGCAHMRSTTVAPDWTDGRSSFRFLPPELVMPAPSEGAPGPAGFRVESVLPVASPANAPPIYPPTALETGCGSSTLVVQLLVDREGRSAAVDERSAAGVSSERCHEQFRGAIASAIRTWRFAPAFLQHQVGEPRVLPDGAVIYPEWETVPIPARVDFEFQFSVVKRTGTVRPRS